MRTRAEIDAEYGVIARVYGDRVFKGAMIQNEIKALHDKMTNLSAEPASDDPGRTPQIVKTTTDEKTAETVTKATEALVADGKKK